MLTSNFIVNIYACTHDITIFIFSKEIVLRYFSPINLTNFSFLPIFLIAGKKEKERKMHAYNV